MKINIDKLTKKIDSLIKGIDVLENK